MKVSLNTVRHYSNVDPAPNGVDELVQKIGAQLGEVEDVVATGPQYDGIVVAKVVTCDKHPNADKLSICLIDDGGKIENVTRNENGYVQVVCGAPNVREGLTIAWIPPGATVPATYGKDPFVLEAKELRGVVSNGMLASASELGISNDHSGLLEITAEDVGQDLMVPGTPFKQLYGLDDVIIEIENKMFTHRPDCFGVLGIARELAGIYGQQFTSPDWYLKVPKIFLKDAKPEITGNLALDVRNEIPELVPRFMAVAMENITIAPSPYWLQALLTRIGVKPINNVVDLTNFLSYVTAQPLHAYDYDKVAELTDSEGAVVTARLPREGETLALLNGKTIEPRKEAIMIAADNKLIGVGGVMGGTSTEVDDSTTRIIIECANFDMYSIRKTSMAHGLFTDAVTRFNKGQSPLQNDRVIVEMMRMAEKYAHGKQASEVIDNRHIDEEMYNRQTINPGIKASLEFINSRLGLSLSSEEITVPLRNVGFACIFSEASDEIEVHAPFWRVDIRIPEDIVEEILRLRGYDTLPNVLPKKTVSPAEIDAALLFRGSLRQRLAGFGANEVLTYSFVNANLLEKAGQDPALAFKLSNALSPNLQHYRLSLTPNLLQLIHPNSKAGHDNFTLFEIGKVHGKSEIGEDDIPKEFGRVALVTADKSSTKSAYFTARAYVDQLTYGQAEYAPLIQDQYKDHKLFQQMLAPYDQKRSALVMDKDKKLLGVVGEFSMETLQAFKLPKYCSGFELFLTPLSKLMPLPYVPLSNYPGITQDLCLEVAADLPYVELWQNLQAAASEVFVEDEAAFQLIDIFAGEKIAGKKRLTFRVKVVNYQRTLQEEHVNRLLDSLSELLVNRGARRV